jgi:hypothetical protein
VIADLKEQLSAPRHPPVDGSVQEAIVELRLLLDRYLSSIESLDQKAALVVPALGAIGVLTAPVKPLGQTSAFAALFLSLAVSAAVLAFVMSLRALRAKRSEIGADPVKLALQTSLDPDSFRQGIADSLAIAVCSLRSTTEEKAKRLNLSLLAGAISVVCFLASRIVEA